MSQRVPPKRSSFAAALVATALAGTSLLATLPAFASSGMFSAVVSSNAGQSNTQASPAGRTKGVRVADADCSAAAAEAAAQTGGQVLSVSSRNDGGRTVCVVTVLVPGEDGQRPRKRTLTLPQ